MKINLFTIQFEKDFMTKNKLFLLLRFGIFVMMMGIASPNVFAQSNANKAILVVSPGYSHANVLKLSIDSVQEAFPDYYVCLAVSGETAVNELKSLDGIKVGTVRETLERLLAEGYTEVALQPLHITNDEDFTHVQETVQFFKKSKSFEKLSLGRPLLTYRGQPGQSDDYLSFLFAVKGELNRLQCCNGLVLVGHVGAQHSCDVYTVLQKKIDDTGFGNIFICALDGNPSLEDVVEKLHSKRLKKITIVPCAFSIKDNGSVYDISVQDIDISYSKLKACGTKVEIYNHGLGENFNIQQLYIQHLKEALENTQTESLQHPGNKPPVILQQISIREAMLLWKKKAAVFVDVRTPEEYRQGHVPGARLIPLAELASRIQEVSGNTKVLLICSSGKRSADANIILQQHGFVNTYSVADGMLAWSEKLEK